MLDFGEDKAKEFTNRHEEGNDPNAEDVKMDLANNASGIEVGKRMQAAGKGKAEVADTCENMANRGELVTLK